MTKPIERIKKLDMIKRFEELRQKLWVDVDKDVLIDRCYYFIENNGECSRVECSECVFESKITKSEMSCGYIVRKIFGNSEWVTCEMAVDCARAIIEYFGEEQTVTLRMFCRSVLNETNNK